MLGKEFNLIDEPWICVLNQNGEMEEVSLRTCFTEAHQFQALSGELPTQDVAILRLLLAILHATYGKQEDGSYISVNEAKLGQGARAADMYKRWNVLWQRGRFDMGEIGAYLDKWHERFWLFHPERPFYQVADMKEGTSYTAAKLNGSLSESGNKVKLFSARDMENKSVLSYSEAARWLPHIIGFDDTSAKPTRGNGKKPSPGAGWLGQLGLVYPNGRTLFETLLLNFVLVRDTVKDLWDVEKPVWSLNEVPESERVALHVPNNASALLTLQSRRICLFNDKGKVTGFRLLGGDFLPKTEDKALGVFPAEEVPEEKMTLWRYTDKPKQGERIYKPKRHDPNKQVWREFSSLVTGNQNREPGVVTWLRTLERKKILPEHYISLVTTGVHYADKDFYVKDVIKDELTFVASIMDALEESEEDYATRITQEVTWTEKLVQILGYLAKNIAISSGDTDNKSLYEKENFARQTLYDFLDQPFRVWLKSIEPESEVDFEDYAKTWRNEAKMIAERYGRELVATAGVQAIVGRTYKDRRYTAPEAFQQFERNIWRHMQ